MNAPLSRRAWLAALASSAAALTACGAPEVVELTSEEGRVLQWEGDDLLVLVSGFRKRYHVGEALHVRLLVNNPSTRVVEVRLRTKLLGRGDQVVVEAEPALLTVKPEDAASAQRELLLGRNLTPGEHTLSVEVPPWKVEGRDTGRGAVLRATVAIDAA